MVRVRIWVCGFRLTGCYAEKSPRGIPGFLLTGGNFTEWKVQGKLGGYTKWVVSQHTGGSADECMNHSYPDKVRGVLNEGGLYGEREGWHLPGYDTSSWEERDLSDGLPSGGAGVGFFVTTFDLSIPEGTDVLMSFQFDTVDQPYRATLFVNGWNYGKVCIHLDLDIASTQSWLLSALPILVLKASFQSIKVFSTIQEQSK